MSQSKEFIDAVTNGELTLVRVMLKDSLVMDPTFKEFNELISYAEKNISGLYEEHDDEDFETESSLWDKGYMNKQLNNLMYNFSKSRIEHLKKVCSVIYSDRISNASSKRSYGEQSNINKVTGTKSIAKTVAAGGIGMAVLGFALEKTILATAGVAAVVIGGVMLISSKDE